MSESHKEMKCGLIGEHLSHSFSPLIHGELADYSYTLCELSPDALESFMRAPTLDAFNVTIPYKKDVIPYLDYISDEAKAIGAVNTVVRSADQKLYGYNTDYFGFSHMLDLAKTDVRGKKALVLGRGGAALTVCAVLRDRGVREIVSFGSRDNTPENVKAHSDAEIIVNATPIGMYPNNYASPTFLEYFPRVSLVLDLIFNPARTALLLDAERRGIPHINGLPMLVAQAARAFEFFTGEQTAKGEIERVTSLIAERTENIVLVGMPGCGKTTVGTIIAKALDRDFYDADNEFEKMHGISPADCITQRGEEHFRELETITLAQLGKMSSTVIATGGGAVTREINYDILHQNSKIFFIERELGKLARGGRPLSLSTSAEDMYTARIPHYKRFADATVESHEIPEDTSDRIIEKFKELI